MTSRSLAAIALAALLALTACGGSGGNPDAAQDRRPAPAQPEKSGTTSARISTFALDVDTASYSYARRTLQEGRWPEPGQVRPEEFVNSFRQDYAEPRDNGFTVHTDGARLPGEAGAVLRVGLQTRGSSAQARRPVNLTFVIDVSGSMAEPGRLDLVQQSLRTLLDQLTPGDQVAVVAFSDEAELLAAMTPLAARDDLHAAVDRLVTKGGTNLEAGIVLGYEEASRAFRPAATNRVIVLSDGLANQGDTAWQGILDRVKESAAEQITLLTVGVGREYGDELMEQLADNGDGAAIYVSSVEEAEKAFVTRLPATVELRARDAKAQVEFNPAVVEEYHLVGYENRALEAEEFRDDSADGGEVGPGHSVTALYALKLKPGAKGHLATATVRWQDPDTRQPTEAAGSVDVGALARELWSDAPLRLQVDVVAAAFALQLRDDESLGLDLPTLGEHATRLAAAAEDPMVTELAGLIGKARETR
ncbi:von Willebrand factor type A domain-containing protein [Nonomuraea sp. MCN248]|uniref:von Willebrand factor type A domain-containing protein n=1 Tax=Nonomuraea corallina TaxID=2989783 RepID=A0ABT4S8J0_9ACTN|nr:von Willebrand factor type A domain-containing protein [Nonomuraea corallina]MDA0633490.1 von Willebrand factor type A domain-containing protein [Nonomuraea corallina]